MTEPEKEEAFGSGEQVSHAVPAQPAFTPSAWPSNPPDPQRSGPRPAGGFPTESFAGQFQLRGPDPAPSPVESETAAPPPPPAATSLAITSTPPDPQQLELELAAAHDELKALHEMLEDLPEIFERKFQQRLATVMEHQKHLQADNQALRERLYNLSPGETDGPGSGRSQPLLLPTVAPKQSWVGALKRALRLGGPQKINRHDDGRPITA